MPKQGEAKSDGVINPQNYNFKQFYHGKFWCSQTLRINRSRPYNLATCALLNSWYTKFINKYEYFDTASNNFCVPILLCVCRNTCSVCLAGLLLVYIIFNRELKSLDSRLWCRLRLMWHTMAVGSQEIFASIMNRVQQLRRIVSDECVIVFHVFLSIEWKSSASILNTKKVNSFNLQIVTNKSSCWATKARVETRSLHGVRISYLAKAVIIERNKHNRRDVRYYAWCVFIRICIAIEKKEIQNNVH